MVSPVIVVCCAWCDTAVLEHYEKKVSDLSEALQARLTEEAAERQARQAQMEVERAGNLLEHHEEIMQRPPRTWFQVGTL